MADASWPTGDSEVAGRIRAGDWSATPLGPIDHWPQSLRSAIGLILPSSAQIVLFWGTEFVALYNDAYAPTIGDKHPHALGRPAREHWSEMWDDLEALLKRVRETGETVTARDRPFYIERHGGNPETVYFDISYSPVLEADGSVGGVLCIVSETTERVLTEAALRESEERLRQFGEASPDILWSRDAETLQWVYLTSAFETIYGSSREEALSGDTLANWTGLILPEDREMVLAMLEQVRQGERVSYEFRIRRPSDGAVRWLRDTDFPVRDATGRITHIGGVARDVTAEKDAASRLQVLVAELQHRTRNLIAVVRSIADRTLANSASFDDFRLRYRDRLAALGRANGLLSRFDEGDNVSFDELLEAELSAHGGGSGQVNLDGPLGIRLRSSAVKTLALAVHELVTNAVKYGALSTPEGRLAVTWKLVDGDGSHRHLFIDWHETGVVMPDASVPPKRTGYGRELIERALPYQLEAETGYTFSADGIRCTILLPVIADAA